MKPSSKRILGIILIVLAVLTLPIAFCQVIPLGFVDFPCFDDQIRKQEISSETRIVYCISIWPRQALSGGAIYDEGKTDQEAIKVGALNFRRDGQNLLVNNHMVTPREAYTTTHWNAALNPWVIFTSRFEIKNEGINPIGTSSPAEALYVTGDVYESWLPNPLGLIILGSGIWLFRQGKTKQKLAAENIGAG